MSKLQSALELARQGFYVFPLHNPLTTGGCSCGDSECGSIGKHPRIKDWENKATKDPKQIRTWWQKWPHANIGLALGRSGHLAIDIDPRNGGSVDLLPLAPAERETVTQITGGGGEHLIYLQPQGMKFGNSDNELAEGINVRGSGGLIAGPGSLHASGTFYEWQPGRSPADLQPLPLPFALGQLLKPKGEETPQARPVVVPPAPVNGSVKPYVRAAFEGELTALGAAPVGDRNQQLNRAAFALGQFVAAGELSELEVETELTALALAIGLGERETAKTIQSGLSKGKQKPRQIPPPVVTTRPASNGTGGQAPAETQQAKPEKPKRKTSKDYLAALELLGYSFRMNACNDRLEVNEEPISDAIRATIRTRMRDIGYNRHIAAIEDAYLMNAYRNQYHPVRDYLEALPWDGYPHIAELAAHFTDVDGVFGKWLVKWLVGAIDKVYTASQNPMLVLDGPQGIGKSHFVGWLGSPLPDYFIEAPINPENKDDDIRLISKWLWEVAELGATTRKADREALKFFLTKRTVTVRKPYGRDDIVKPAMASMVGTINNEAGFLNDPTGDRRFLVCELTDINWDYAKIDPSQVWAEAYHEWKSGYDWRLAKSEAIKRSEINARYRIDSHVIGLFLKYFGYTTDPTDPRFIEWISSTDILETLSTYGLSGNSKANLMELSAGLKELGITKKRQIQTGFLGVWRK